MVRRRKLSELVALMRPSEVKLVGADLEVGPDVVLDNRQATAGSLFLCFPGERVDGHDFAVAAAQAGAAAVMGTRVTQAGLPHLVVDETVRGVSALARGLVAEARAAGMVSIGVTGSSGKTSTKDLIAQVLETHGPTVSPLGSQNNEIGVPLTACRVTEETRYLVSEMGARGIGHIAWLTSLVPLDIAAVLNVGQAHVGEFGDVGTTARAKQEILADLSPQGWAVLGGDDPATVAMRESTRARIAWFGEGDLPDGDLQVRARNVTLDGAAQASFDLVVRDADGERTAPVALKVVGRPQVLNALAAAAVAIAVGMSVEQVAAALSRATRRSSWRMELIHRSDDVLILNDAYNANPDSVAAALRTTAELVQFQRARHPGARAIAVLGDMLELGPFAQDSHEDTGRLAADLGLSEVIAVGEHAESIRAGAAESGTPARTAQRSDVAASLRLRPGDVVLVKGSRGIGLEEVAAQLTTAEGEQE